ncbi:MAG TPA: TonB-dependent receptor [Gammaproteobacteria bacterium]|nr:TonB-dependent receptor [Gammaproteobacteria bacterium]
MKTVCLGRRTALSLAVLLALGTTTESKLFAQQQPAGGQQGLEEITVTGTRIARRDYVSQSPIVTVDSAAFDQRTSIGLEAALNQLPQFSTVGAGSQAANSAASTPFPQAGSAPGAATVNFRGLGTNRNLVLINGRRAQPINGLLVVDLNTIPSVAVDRVEAITGGAAAVYGADAISGVINVITKRDFEGLELRAQSGISQEGDGKQTSFSGILGAAFDDDRGSVMLGADYTKRDIIFSRDRDWVVRGWHDPGTSAGGIGSSNLSQYDPARASFCAKAPQPGQPVPAQQFQDCGQPSVFVPNRPAAGFFPPAVTRPYIIDQNGNIFDAQEPLNPAHPYTGPLGGDSTFKINPDRTLGYFDPAHSYLQLPLERYAVFGSGRIKLTDKIDVFSELHYSQTFATSSGFVSGVFNVWSPTIPYNHLYDDPNSPTFGQPPPPNPGEAPITRHPVPATLAALLNSRPFPDAPWTYVGGLDYLPNFTTETTSNVYQVIGGLESDFTVRDRDWNWTFYASHGNTTVNARQPEGFPSLERLQNLFNADMYGQNFDISGLPGFSPVAVTGHCTSGLPIFNADGSVNDTPTVSQDCADYVVLRMNNIYGLQQDIVEGTVTGGLANLPGGTLSFAFGANYRREHFTFDPDSGYNANQDFPNVVQNVILPVAVDGETSVTEVYGELSIPLVKDKKFVQSFEIDPGIRYSDYDTVGSVNTYKVMADWRVNDKIRFRGGHQFANRAPNVTELFTPKGGSQLGGGNDACAYYPTGNALTPTWGNRPENPNRLNLQVLCQYLMTREGAPASIYEPGQPSADNYNFNVFGGTTAFPFTIGITEGNPDLDSEEANTYTWGVVLNPVERLTLSLDWYQIKLKNAIGIPTHDAVYQQCMDAQYNPLIGDAPGSHTGPELAAGNPFCALIQREFVGGPPGTPGNLGADRKYSARYINQGGIETQGYDLQVDWGTGIGDAGNFNMNIQANFLDKYATSPFPGAAFIDYTGTTTNSSYDLVTLSNFTYSRNAMVVGLRWQHLPELDPAPDAAGNALGVDSHDQFDLYGSWSFGERYQLRGGIDNLLNADPEWVGRTTTNNAVGSTSPAYDQVGRQFFLGLTVTL